ncbi:MAG TPA: hypothetical protein VFV13_05235 [Acidimicrobiia bacterium]|nr:hypothetical protein [Acidimicrobiia bacterium]
MSNDRDREIIVTDTRSGGNFGMIVAGALIAIALVLGIWYLVNNTSDESLPEEVEVTVVQE